MNISLSDHFSFKKILRFTVSPILMMIFISIYGVVDGFFISNYASLDAYAGVNVIFPIIMVIGGLGFMFGTGGSALSSKLLGEQDRDGANQVFTMMIKTVLIIGIIVSVIGCLFIKPIAVALGKISGDTTEAMVEEAIKYGRILSLGQVFFMLQNLFHSYFVVDEKPQLGFRYTIFAGITNIVFDALFIAVFNWGVVGAAIATVMGYMVGSIFPFIHFIKNKNGNIKLVKTKLKLKPIMQSCFNGCSEFVSNISSSIVGMVFNIQLLKYYGQNGVSAYGTLMYVSFMFVAIFIGFAIGMAPVIGYNYGANNKKELKSVLLKMIVIILITSGLMVLLSEFVGPQFARLYLREDQELLDLAVFAFKIYSLQFIFCGFAIFLSSFFTALNNGIISAIISFIRTLICQILFVVILPLIIGAQGIWWSIVIAEAVACIIAFIFLFTKKKKYGYL